MSGKKHAKITHIQTGAERAAGNHGRNHDQEAEDRIARSVREYKQRQAQEIMQARGVPLEEKQAYLRKCGLDGFV